MRLGRLVATVALVLIASAAVAEQLPDGGPSGRGNVVCSPNPLILSVSNSDGTVSVEYSGGGSGLLYSYSMKFTWDSDYAHTSADSVSEGDLLSGEPATFATFFDARRTGVHEITVDAGRLGQVDGAAGPGTLFTIDFSAVTDGTSPVDITIISTRDRDNNDLTGFAEDDGEVQVDLTPPNAPTMAGESTYTQGTANTVTWSDESATGADEYYAERATDTGFTTDLVSSSWVAVLSHEFTGLTDGQLYYYRVMARDAALNESGWSGTESSTQDDTAPATAAEDPGATQNSFLFDVPYSASDATSGVQYVELWYQVDGGGYVQFPGTFTTTPISFTASGDGVYDFHTIGTDNVGNVEVAPGAPDASTTVDTGAPNVPTMAGESTYTQGTANTVAWSDESATGADEYYAERATDTGFTTDLVSSGWVAVLSHEFTGLTDGQIYYYRVMARDAALNESGWSGTESSTQDDTAPATAALDPGATQNNVTFDVPYSASDGTSGVQYVELWYQVDGGGYVQFPGTFTTTPISFTATGDGVYDFHTIGTDNVGNVEVAPGAPDASTTVDTGAPNVPTMAGESTYTQGTANTVAWSDESATGADEYYAERATDTGFTTDLVSSGWVAGLSYEFTGLTDGQLYYYRVKARDTALNESGWSGTESSTQDDTAPATAALDPGATQNNVTFDVPYSASDGTSGVQYVELWYQVDGGGYVQFPGTFTTTPISFTATGDGVYDFHTIGTDNVGNVEVAPGAPDASTTVDTTAPTVTPVAIENLTLVDTDEYAKDTDNLELTATVTDNIYTLEASDITADFSTLLVGGLSAVPAEGYASNVATWTVALASVTLQGDGPKTVTVTAEDGIGHIGTGTDQITVDNTAPTAITGFAAAPGHNKAELTWSDASGTDSNFYQVMIRSNAWVGYPNYTGGGPVYPADAGDGAFEWQGPGTSHTATYLDYTYRDIYYYGAFAVDMALNYGPADAGAQDRSTNYWLGDVANTVPDWIPDGNVGDGDITKLSGTYGVSEGSAGFEDKCDVGPTDDHSRFGIPLPDDIIQFEDLMIFAMNYGAVSLRVVPFLPLPETTQELALSVEERSVSASGEVELSLVLSGNADELKGLSGVLTYDTAELEFVSARLGSEMSSPLGDVFFWYGSEDGRIQVDLVVLGTDVTAGGSGEVAVLTFAVLSDEYGVEIESADLRGAENRPLDADLEGFESSPELPTLFRLVQNVPNPFNPVTQIAYHVPHESAVSIRIYDVSGRLVRTLVDGVTDPGRHVAVWDGSTDSGGPVGSGVYFCTMEAPDFHESHKMMLLK